MGTNEVPASLATLLGGEAMKVTLRDGTVEEVFVRQLPLRLIGKWSGLDSNGGVDAEAQLIELFLDKPEGFADGLTVESAEAVLAKGDALNRPTFVRWQQRHANRTREWVKAGEATEELRKELNLPAASPTSPQNSASSSDGSQPK